MIYEMKGNLLDQNYIAHQVNCRGVMGAGVAWQIKKNLLTNSQFIDYVWKCNLNGATLLGHVDCYYSYGKMIFNLFAEDKPTGNGLDTDYDALHICMDKIRRWSMKNGIAVAIPGYIGCGLAGGDWEKVYNDIIEPLFGDEMAHIRIVYIQSSVDMLVSDYNKIPGKDTIEKAWHGFPAGTLREQIRDWFRFCFQEKL